MQAPSMPSSYLASEERNVLRKLDRRLVAFLSVLYFFSYLDRVNIGFANVANKELKATLSQTLGLSSAQYGFAVSIFFIPYTIFEIPSNLILKKMYPRRWISRIMVTWGLVSTFTALVSDYKGLLICRFLRISMACLIQIVGLFEAGFVPGVVYYLSFWYKPQELGYRLVLFFCSATGAGAIGGFLASGITQMHGIAGLHGWQWLFIVEGVPSVLLGIVCWFYLPDNPDECSMLSEREKFIVKDRLKSSKSPLNENVAKKSSARSKMNYLKQVVTVMVHPRSIVFALLTFSTIVSPYAFSFFLPTLVSNMGFKSYLAQLLSSPPYVVAVFFSIWFAWNSDRVKERKWHLIIAYCVQFTCFMLLSRLTMSVGLKYALTLICVNVSVSVLPVLLAWQSEMIQGESDLCKAVSPAFALSIGNISGVVGPMLYTTGGGTQFGQMANSFVSLGAIVLTLVLVFYQRNYVKY